MNTSARHVETLNTIDVDFDAKNPSETAVRQAWKAYVDHLGTPPNGESWLRRSQELLLELLHSMGRALGYKIDKTDIKNVVYHPTALAQLQTDEDLARKAMIALATGSVSVPVHIVEVPRDRSQLPQIQETVSHEAVLEHMAKMPISSAKIEIPPELLRRGPPKG